MVNGKSVLYYVTIIQYVCNQVENVAISLLWSGEKKIKKKSS